MDGGVAQGGDSAPGFMCPPATAQGTCGAPADIRCPYPKLSQTGCVDATNPLKLADVVIPYEVNSPLWSDGAVKTRGMRIPAGEKIHVKDCVANPNECCVLDPTTLSSCLPPYDDGKWVFPVGTVMVKNFMFPDTSQASGYKFFETRLFIHVSDQTGPDGGVQSSNWIGYGYQWNDAQTEATVTSDYVYDAESMATFQTTDADGGTQSTVWHYPSRAECLQCHSATTPTGGYTLGPETIQMNRVVAGDTMNQIDKLAAMDLFDVPPPKPYLAALVAPYPGQAGSPPAGASLDVRARSYLHANCSFCHRPDGTFTSMDLRFATPLAATGTCGAMPAKGDQGVPGALILTPGQSASSVMWLRMTAPATTTPTDDTGRMPPIASFVVDTQATTLISDWIDSITTCPAM
jgi:hypothetical protein